MEQQSNNKWWGYIHANGNIQVKRYFDKRDTDEAEEILFAKKYLVHLMQMVEKKLLNI